MKDMVLKLMCSAYIFGGNAAHGAKAYPTTLPDGRIEFK